MENTGKLSPQEIKIQGLVDRFLNLRTANNNLSSESWHLDEDLLSAFVEGNLNERESQPIVSHLVDCTFCRHVTAELVRLDMAFTDEEVRDAETQTTSPSKISEVLSGLLSRIFGSGDAAVFAHQEEEDKEKDETKEEN
ncbi:hypothetical protein BH10ACI1_BH10ACI1_10450 [soil metagenome]